MLNKHALLTSNLVFIMSIVIKTPEIKEYHIMRYYWGAWWTKFVICAETDKEAIFDADNFISENGTQGYRTALCINNRFVKKY